MKSLRPPSFIGFFKTIRLGGQEGTILITLLMRLNVVATNRIRIQSYWLKANNTKPDTVTN
jgi:hypothetical protein